MPARSISLYLLSNVFVEMSQPFVRHMFDAHDQLLLNTTLLRLEPVLSGAVLVRWLASLRHRSSRGLSQTKLSRCDGRSGTRKYAPQSRVCRAKFEPVPSCACRSDKLAAQSNDSSLNTCGNDMCFSVGWSVRFPTLVQNFGASQASTESLSESSPPVEPMKQLHGFAIAQF